MRDVLLLIYIPLGVVSRDIYLLLRPLRFCCALIYKTALHHLSVVVRPLHVNSFFFTPPTAAAVAPC